MGDQPGVDGCGSRRLGSYFLDPKTHVGEWSIVSALVGMSECSYMHVKVSAWLEWYVGDARVLVAAEHGWIMGVGTSMLANWVYTSRVDTVLLSTFGDWW